jgi:hypothetical protein
MIRAIGISCATLGALAFASVPAQAKYIWSCQYARDKLLMTATIRPDPEPPGLKLPATDLVMKGSPKLVLSQVFLSPGKPDKVTADGYRFKAYIQDEGASIIFSPERQIASSEWLVDRRMPNGGHAGMFMNRAVEDGIGRPLSADFSDLTGAKAEEFIRLRFMLPPNFYEQKRYYGRMYVAEFKATHAKGLAKAMDPKATADFKKC